MPMMSTRNDVKMIQMLSLASHTWLQLQFFVGHSGCHPTSCSHLFFLFEVIFHCKDGFQPINWLLHHVINLAEPLPRSNHLSRNVSISPQWILRFRLVLSRSRWAAVNLYSWSDASSPVIVWVGMCLVAASWAPEGGIGGFSRNSGSASVIVVFFFFFSGFWAWVFRAWVCVVANGMRLVVVVGVVLALGLFLFIWGWAGALPLSIPPSLLFSLAKGH